jgi:hypothetical protein
MNLIPIQITGARVNAMAFQYKDDDHVPEFSCTVELIDAHGKKITSISISSASWLSDRCEPSLKLIELAAKIKNELDNMVTIHMNQKQRIIE